MCVCLPEMVRSWSRPLDDFSLLSVSFLFSLFFCSLLPGSFLLFVPQFGHITAFPNNLFSSISGDLHRHFRATSASLLRAGASTFHSFVDFLLEKDRRIPVSIMLAILSALLACFLESKKQHFFCVKIEYFEFFRSVSGTSGRKIIKHRA